MWAHIWLSCCHMKDPAIHWTDHRWKRWSYLTLLIVGLLYSQLQECLPKANMGANLWLQGCLALGWQGLLYSQLQECLPKANTGANLWLQGCLALGKQGRSYRASHVVAYVLALRCISTLAKCMWTCYRWTASSDSKLGRPTPADLSSNKAI